MKKQKSFRIIMALVLVLSLFVAAVPVGACGCNNATEDKNAVPMLKDVKQTGKNQVEVTFDKATDPQKATKPENYWVQSKSEVKASGIATYGKDEQLSGTNALTAEKAEIKAKDATNTVYVITFKAEITPNMQYQIIACYITVPGAGTYNGDNGAAEFTGN